MQAMLAVVGQGGIWSHVIRVPATPMRGSCGGPMRSLRLSPQQRVAIGGQQGGGDDGGMIVVGSRGGEGGNNNAEAAGGGGGNAWSRAAEGAGDLVVTRPSEDQEPSALLAKLFLGSPVEQGAS